MAISRLRFWSAEAPPVVAAIQLSPMGQVRNVRVHGLRREAQTHRDLGIRQTLRPPGRGCRGGARWLRLAYQFEHPLLGGRQQPPDAVAVPGHGRFVCTAWDKTIASRSGLHHLLPESAIRTAGFTPA